MTPSRLVSPSIASSLVCRRTQMPGLALLDMYTYHLFMFELWRTIRGCCLFPKLNRKNFPPVSYVSILYALCPLSIELEYARMESYVPKLIWRQEIKHPVATLFFYLWKFWYRNIYVLLLPYSACLPVLNIILVFYVVCVFNNSF